MLDVGPAVTVMRVTPAGMTTIDAGLTERCASISDFEKREIVTIRDGMSGRKTRQRAAARAFAP